MSCTMTNVTNKHASTNAPAIGLSQSPILSFHAPLDETAVLNMKRSLLPKRSPKFPLVSVSNDAMSLTWKSIFICRTRGGMKRKWSLWPQQRNAIKEGISTRPKLTSTIRDSCTCLRLCVDHVACIFRNSSHAGERDPIAASEGNDLLSLISSLAFFLQQFSWGDSRESNCRFQIKDQQTDTHALAPDIQDVPDAAA